MTQRDNIVQELYELESSLATASPSTIYQVPGNYFEGFAARVMERIRAMDEQDAAKELAILSSFLNNIRRFTPYKVPSGYFEGLEKKLMLAVLENDNYQTPQHELEQLSPLLSGLKKQVPYSIPANYFEGLDTTAAKKQVPAAKVILLSSRKWFRYAAAAVVIAFITLGGFLFINNERIDPADKSYAWVKKNMKKVSTDELDKFIGLSEEEAPVVASNNPANEINEVKELMKNIPDEEIQDFLNDAQVAGPDSDNDILLN